MKYKKIIKQLITKSYCYLFDINYVKGFNLGINAKVVGGERLYLDKNVCIRNNFVLVIQNTGRIEIEEGTDIGQSSRIGCQGYIKIGREVLTGPNVFIADYNHEYRNVSKSIINQGNHFIKRNNGEANIEIGDGSWLGINVVIVGNVRIGKHCIIGANSVVSHDIPDYSVACGSPCKVIKQYNPKTKTWNRIND